MFDLIDKPVPRQCPLPLALADPIASRSIQDRAKGASARATDTSCTTHLNAGRLVALGELWVSTLGAGPFPA